MLPGAPLSSDFNGFETILCTGLQGVRCFKGKDTGKDGMGGLYVLKTANQVNCPQVLPLPDYCPLIDRPYSYAWPSMADCHRNRKKWRPQRPHR